MAFVLPGIVKMSLNKIKSIRNPDTNNSYCVISLYMLYAIIFSACMNFISNFGILLFVMWDYFNEDE